MSIVSGIMGAGAQENAAETAAQSQRDATASQERIYAQMRGDFEPYRDIGLSALPYLQSAVFGGPVSARDTTYSKLSDYDTTRYGKALNKTWYRAPDGSLVEESAVPMQDYTYNPTESPAASYQLRQGNTALMRSLGARGQAGGGGATMKLAELASGVAASDWQNQYNRLLDLVKTGTGASSSTGAAGNQLSSAYGQAGTNLGNIYQNLGQQRASLYSGIGQSNGQIAGALINQNWGSNSGANATYNNAYDGPQG